MGTRSTKANALSAFVPVEGLDHVHTARRGKMRALAVALQKGRVCIYNPVQGLRDATIESLRDLGEVTQIVSPNHFHNRAAAEYSSRFKKAKLRASAGSIPRLGKVTGLVYSNVRGLERSLPEGMTILTPAGLKTGEIWLRISTRKRLAWVVVDAFCGPDSPDHRCATNLPRLIRTFPRFGVKDRDTYRDWLFNQIEVDRPTLLIPCHGGLVSNDSLPRRLAKIATRELS